MLFLPIMRDISAKICQILLCILLYTDDLIAGLALKDASGYLINNKTGLNFPKGVVFNKPNDFQSVLLKHQVEHPALSKGVTDNGERVMLPTALAMHQTSMVPEFDPMLPHNVTAQIGANAFLPCKVRHLGTKSVSWVRTNDSHILTVDHFTFIADERFQAYILEQPEIWSVQNNLQVKYVQARDEALYECQVSTDPKMSHKVYLEVIVPKTEIVGHPEMHVKSGSDVTLRCIVSEAILPPNYIFWYHNTRRVVQSRMSVVKFDTGEEAPLILDCGFDCAIPGELNSWMAELVMKSVAPKDSGNWTCAPYNLNSGSITLHVLTAGEYPAAMQHGSSSPLSAPMIAIVATGMALCNDIDQVFARMLRLMIATTAAAYSRNAYISSTTNNN